jgi:paraquat-inducible protein B
MAETPPETSLSDIPQAQAVAKSAWSLQVVWLIPILAALIGGMLAVKTIMQRGPTITLSFKTAEGIEPGKTKIKFKDVDIGVVKNIVVAPDLSHIIATAELVKEATPYLVEDTRFWVVRTRISGGTVSGIGTLLSGAYIGVDIGKSTAEKDDFVGLEAPPVVSTDTPGREFSLRSSNISSIDVGSPIFYRQLQAGQITSYALDQDGKGITLKAFINAPFDKYVNDDTRFWNASGIDVKLDAGGIKLDTQSLISILIGGIAFETPPESENAPPSAPNTRFTLFQDHLQAMKTPEVDGDKFYMTFNESVRGLEPGAAIDFLGVIVGEVTSTRIDLKRKTQQISVQVEAKIYPSRLTRKSTEQHTTLNREQRRSLLKSLTAKGLRAQLRTGNLLTGQLYIALDFFPGVANGALTMSGNDPELPTIPSSFKELQTTLAALATKFNKLPIEEIGNNLKLTLQTSAKLLQSIDSELAPEAQRVMQDARKALGAVESALASDSGLQNDTRQAMQELARAAQAIRLLADYLERHPEALLRGKPEE